MPRDGERKCCGIIEEAREKRAAKREKAQPWIVLKLAIALTLGIIGYACYVYIGRFCIPMIRREGDALGSRGLGIAFLILFCIFCLMMLWAYVKVVLTPPGMAKAYTRKSPAPMIQNALPVWWDSESFVGDIGGASYQTMSSHGQRPSEASTQSQLHSQNNVLLSATRPPAARLPSSKRDKPQGQLEHADERREGNVGFTDAIPAVATETSDVRRQSSSRVTQNGAAPNQQPMKYTRRPPTTPVLLPEYRYCHKDGFIKPLRAHHCRACGTCILRYDHHCPWIGQCVGARNHRFFVIFVEWGLIFCLWTFSTLVGLNARRHTSTGGDIDPQQIVIIALSALFTIFTFALVVSHIELLTLNQTTVESLGSRRTKDREKKVLTRIHAWYQFGAKRRTRKQWDEDWGDIDTEGNLWWLGSRRQNWESIMGHHVWEWFLPIGQSPDDGISYIPNPRFDSEGRWRPRLEWPAELR